MNYTAPDVPLLAASGVGQEYVVSGRAGPQRKVVRAVRDVSLDIRPGETLGLVGETGSGKSTLARALMQMPAPLSGSVLYRGRDVRSLCRAELRDFRRDVQMIFQEPYGSLNSTWKVSSIIEEPLLGFQLGSRSQRRRRVAELLERVGLDPTEHAARRPHELSGGQCQRVAIARALAPAPSLIVCDEATASLDVVVQKQILTLFHRLRSELNLSYLFISHDLLVVSELSHRVASMYGGRICEVGPRDSLYERPAHPYTAALVAHTRDPMRPSLTSVSPTPGIEPSSSDAVRSAGCSFRSCCPIATPRCAVEAPQMRLISPDHSVACHHPLR